MPGVDTSPIGSGSPPTAVSHASPPSWSFTSFGALSWYFSGSQLVQMSGGSRMWQSASTMRCCSIEPVLQSLLPVRAGGDRPNIRLTPASGKARHQPRDQRRTPGGTCRGHAAARRDPGASTSPGSRPRRPGGCSPTSAPTSCSSSRPTAWPLRALPHDVGRVGRGQAQRGRRRSRRPAPRRAPRRRRHRDRHTRASRAPGRSIPARAPHAAWVSVTPFGLDGPRSDWRAADLGVMAASGNMWMTGDPDRAPVRCTLPSGYAHTGGEVAFAALSALWAEPRRRRAASTVDAGDRVRREHVGDRRLRRHRLPRASAWARTSAARVEIWPHQGRLGVVRHPRRRGPCEALGALAPVPDRGRHPRRRGDRRDRLDDVQPRQRDRRGARRRSSPRSRSGCRGTPTRSSTTSRASTTSSSRRRCRRARCSRTSSCTSRDFFAAARRLRALPPPVRDRHQRRRRSRARRAQRSSAPALGSSEPSVVGLRRRRRFPRARAGRRRVERRERSSSSAPARPARSRRRYFVEHGATVLRIESASRPDFLRVMALGPKNPHGLEGSPLYDVLNVGKRNATFNLKDPRAVELVKTLMLEWADAVRRELRAARDEGLRPRLRVDRPGEAEPGDDQRVPQRPDRAAQGLPRVRLAGLRARRASPTLTGWPDRAPVGPYGTITDSLAPRYVATAVAAGLHYRRRTGRGVYLDSRQVESGIYTLSPWLLEADADGTIVERAGNRSLRVRVPHGAFPCADETLADGTTSATAGWRSRAGPTTSGRRSPAIHRRRRPGPRHRSTRGSPAIDEVEAARRPRGPSPRSRLEVAEQLQAAGIEAVPVQDFGDIHADPQVAHRSHFVPLTHPFMGPRPVRAQRVPGGRARRWIRPRRAHTRPGQRLGIRRCVGTHGRRAGDPRGRRRLDLSTRDRPRGPHPSRAAALPTGRGARGRAVDSATSPGDARRSRVRRVRAGSASRERAIAVAGARNARAGDAAVERQRVLARRWTTADHPHLDPAPLRRRASRTRCRDRRPRRRRRLDVGAGRGHQAIARRRRGRAAATRLTATPLASSSPATRRRSRPSPSSSTCSLTTEPCAWKSRWPRPTLRLELPTHPLAEVVWHDLAPGRAAG